MEEIRENYRSIVKNLGKDFYYKRNSNTKLLNTDLRKKLKEYLRTSEEVLNSCMETFEKNGDPFKTLLKKVEDFLSRESNKDIKIDFRHEMFLNTRMNFVFSSLTRSHLIKVFRVFGVEDKKIESVEISKTFYDCDKYKQENSYQITGEPDSILSIGDVINLVEMKSLATRYYDGKQLFNYLCFAESLLCKKSGLKLSHIILFPKQKGDKTFQRSLRKLVVRSDFQISIKNLSTFPSTINIPTKRSLAVEKIDLIEYYLKKIPVYFISYEELLKVIIELFDDDNSVSKQCEQIMRQLI